MLYNIFKVLFYLTTRAYFRSITVEGKNNIPNKNTPVIFAANHPSAFMDPILLGALIDRPLYFLARGDVFKYKVIRPIFNQLHMIPVYKSDLSPKQVHKNESTFEKCHEHLGRNKSILIFPEGTSKTERRLRPIKTGTARIALGAEEKQNFDLDLKVIPVGLNYSDPHIFKSDVLVNFGEAISLREYKDRFQEDPRQAVNQLTEQIKLNLEKQIVIIENEQLEKTIEQIESLYRSTLRQESSMEEKGTQDFRLSQDIVKAVEHYARVDPSMLKEFGDKMTDYIKDLESVQLRDTQIRSTSISLNVLGRILYFLLGFPFFLFGFLSNYIPFKLSGFISDNLKIREDFVGAIKLAVGLLVFLISYLVESILVASLFGNLWAVLFFISLYPAGFFTIDYIKTYYKLRGAIHYLSLFMRKSDMVARLKTRRQELIDELEKRKEDYLKMQES